MAHAIWNGSISFGLIEIPVALVGAESSHDLDLVFLDRHDLAPVGNQRINKKTGAEVAWKDIVRGYEYEKGEYVVVTDADLKRANPEATQTIDLLHFVDAAEIDPVYYERPYYVEPQKKKSKGYVLLRETLAKTNKLAIGKVVLRTREHLVALGAREKVLVLHLLRFPEELRDMPDVGEAKRSTGALKSAGVSAREVEMATRLVEDMTQKFDPKLYRDEYRDDLLHLIKEKVRKGETHVIDEEETASKKPRKGEIFDLMPLLEKSLRSRTRETPKPRRLGTRKRAVPQPAVRKSRSRKSA